MLSLYTCYRLQTIAQRHAEISETKDSVIQDNGLSVYFCPISPLPTHIFYESNNF